MKREELWVFFHDQTVKKSQDRRCKIRERDQETKNGSRDSCGCGLTRVFSGNSIVDYKIQMSESQSNLNETKQDYRNN
jgi:hypothetical protein